MYVEVWDTSHVVALPPILKAAGKEEKPEVAKGAKVDLRAAVKQRGRVERPIRFVPPVERQDTTKTAAESPILNFRGRRRFRR